LNKARILLVDDEKKALVLLSGILEDNGFSVRTSSEAPSALKILQNETVDAVILDLKMPGIDGLTALGEIKKSHPHLPVIMLSGHGTIEKAVKSVKQGAFDFLEKPITSQKVIITIRNALAMSQLRRDKGYLLQEVSGQFRMVGQSQAMKRIVKTIDRIAPTDSPVLICGESGTGKELVARAIHFSSRRAARPFIPLNCAAIPEDLLESELFGYEPGAFTGANRAKPGLFEQADHGTLFLDEITEMNVRLQPKILRAVETTEIQRLGSTDSQKVDIRLITASNRDMEAALQEKHFREDLYYRISVLTIDVPPLRERIEDIPLLVEHFAAEQYRKRDIPPIHFHAHALERLMTHDWPGNIRELKNLVEKIVVLSDTDTIMPEMVEYHLSRRSPRAADTLEETRQKAEREKLLAKLHALDWNYKQVAKELHISRATLFNKMKQHDIPGKRQQRKA
jgi:two-component system nitrogen regulation response regulator NtrX